MTLMVRDEADIIAPMIDHHLAQGIDTIIVTDNGSVDGTYEILEGYGDAIDLRRDPVHRKQQHSVVTAMARDAYTRHGADWVINADADEFWMPTAPGQSLRDAFGPIPRELATFTVPVIDMTGAPARRGTGLQRLVYRDTRPPARLREVGLKAHSTPDAVHVGSDTVEVTQGNHAVNLAGDTAVPFESPMEVLHFPWRSWEQFERKVQTAGVAYESNPDLQPSPNHHGMREYRRWQAGALFAFYLLRHPSEEELAAGATTGELTHDPRVAGLFRSPVADEPLDPVEEQAARAYGPVLNRMELEARAGTELRDARIAEILRYVDDGKHTIDALQAELDAVRAREHALNEELHHFRTRKIVRIADAAGSIVARRRTRG